MPQKTHFLHVQKNGPENSLATSVVVEGGLAKDLAKDLQKNKGLAKDPQKKLPPLRTQIQRRGINTDLNHFSEIADAHAPKCGSSEFLENAASAYLSGP